MMRVALTGGVASGKSSAAAEFRRLGVPVIDADQVARDIVRPGSAALSSLVKLLGPGILQNNGDLDRSAMRRMIFSDAALRARAEAVLHPEIERGINKALQKVDAAYAIVEIPLLVETGSANRYDRVLVIDVPIEVQLERLRAREILGTEEARAIINAQASRDERLAAATDVIDNTGSLEQLRAQAHDLHEHFLAAAKRFASRPGPASE